MATEGLEEATTPTNDPTLVDEDDGDEEVTPSGIAALFFTMFSQTKFGIVADQDVTAQQPRKFIPKADIWQDIQDRGVISDFHPCREKIKAFPGEEMLLVYDPSHKYGQNFYLCLTVEAMEDHLRSQEEEQGNAAGGGKPGADSNARGWVSMGSEKEIAEATVKNNRDLLVVSISRQRKEFGGAFKFSDRDAHDALVECRPFKDPNFELKRLEHDVAIQAVPGLDSRGAQTTWFRPVNSYVQYEPLDLEEDERDVVTISDPFDSFIKGAVGKMEDCLLQNTTMDIFRDDYSELAEEDSGIGNKADNFMKEFQSFTDLVYSKNKTVSAVSWQPNSRGVVAVSCTELLSFDKRVDNSSKVQSAVILVWNFVDPIHPQFVLEAPADVYAFQFHPSQPHLIAGGSISGQVILWDISDALQEIKNKGKKMSKDDDDAGSNIPVIKPVVVSLIEASHQSAVTDLRWLPAEMEVNAAGKLLKTTSPVKQFTTTSTDGQVLFWDVSVREKVAEAGSGVQNWVPTYKIPLNRIDSTGDLSPSKISLQPGSCFFFATTEDGEFVLGDWQPPPKAVDPDVEVRHNYSKQVSVYHSGPIVDLQRSPFFESVILTVGDWSFHLWKGGNIERPILSSPYCATSLTCARWSPTRPGVLFAARSDGFVEIWDLLDRSHEPSLRQSISSVAITSMEFMAPGTIGTTQLLAVGDDLGTLHIMEIPRNLARAAPSERQVMEGFFDREVKRVDYTKARSFVRDQERRDKELGMSRAAAVALEEAEAEAEAEEADTYEAAEAEYRMMEEAFKKELGLDAAAMADAAAAAAAEGGDEPEQ